MKTLNKNLLENCNMNEAEMRVCNGGIILETMETSGKHGDGKCIKDVYSFHEDGRVEQDWYYVECN